MSNITRRTLAGAAALSLLPGAAPATPADPAVAAYRAWRAANGAYETLR